MCGRVREASDEFVDVTDALNGSQWTSIPANVRNISGAEGCEAYPV